MVSRSAAAVAVVAACGNDVGAPPAPDAAAIEPTGCVATYAGNFTETDTTFGPCAMMASAGQLVLAVPTMALGSDVAVSIQLGTPPVTGTYTSETVTCWSAEASVDVGGPMCVYTAGDAEAPNGNFTLVLDQVDADTGVVHGALSLLMYVLVPPYAPCGSDTTETMDVTF